ncbi:CrcB family protein [Acuticoccus sp. M5D2P5]|uniref:fluoride efflux transporter FluC n=1 Tax=Acuticoccus kalidii TaxID=2910977 RepID=UPI001F2A8684|nr:CrcB family protein [Acuticoccus kalidii]
MSPLVTSLLVAAGGGMGALARFWIGVAGMAVSPAFPLATLFVNVVGGVLIGWIGSSMWATPMVRAALMSGFLGGFTTFSTFSLEVVRMVEEGRVGRAALYIGLSVFLAIGGAAIGVGLSRTTS